MATLQGKAVKNTYRQVLQIGANNVGVSGSLQPVQDGGGVNTSLSLSTTAATITGTLTINGDLIITGGGIQIQDLIDDTVASLIQNGTGITWAYNDTLRTLTPTITIATADGGVQGDFVQYNTGANEANAVAKMYWNSSEGTVDLGLMGGNVILPIGQKQVARVLNNSGSILNKSAYQVVKISSAQGQRLAVTLAQANNDANSTDTIGLVAENIANNQEGFVTSSGLITGVDTTGDLQLEDWNDGDVLYLSPTTPGAITKVKPVAPQHTVIVGFVVYAHKNNGKIYVKVDNGYELDELHNVRITSVADNNILQYNSSLAVWENVAGTTTNIAEGTNLYYTQGRFDSAFAAKSTTNLAEGTNLYFTTARGDANFATNFATKTTTNLPEGTNLYFTNARSRGALSVTAGTGIAYNSTTGNFNLGSIPNASLTNSSVTINGLSLALGASISLTTTDIAEGTNLYWTDARFDSRFGTKTTTNLAEGTNLYYTQARFNTAFDAKTTTDLDEGTNLYYTDARSRAAFSENAVGLDYSSGSGILSLTSGYAIPTSVKLGQYDTAYNRSIVSAAVTGTSTKTLSLTQQDANVITASWTDQGITTINGTANQIAATTVGNTTTLAFTNDVTMPNNLVVSGNLTINGTATYVNTESISSKDPLFEVANTNNTTDAVDIGYYGRYYDAVQERVEFTGLFRDASDAGKFKIFTGLVDEPTNVVNTTGTGYTVATLVANVDGNLNGTANAANILSTARTIAASGDATWSVSFNGSANVTSALTLANTGVTATTYGTSTAVPTIAVDSKGRITSASNTNITFPVTTVNGFAGTVVLTTSDVAEGTNQYFTTARAQASITGGASSVVTANLTASRALVSDGSGKIAASATTTTTEIGYLAGVTSAIQTQLNGKLNLTGGTLTGGLIGTTGSFSSSGSGDTFTIGHTSGSGIALNITKNGNGEGLYINKASGSGNAATIIGNLGGTTASFSGILTTPQVKAATSAGLSINANSGTQVADFGAGGGANITFFGGLTGTIGSFIDNTGNSPLRFSSTTASSKTGYLYADATIIGITDTLNASAGLGGIFFNSTTKQTLLFNNGATSLSISSNGAATFSSSVTALSGAFGNTGGFIVNYSGSVASRSWRLINDINNFGEFSIQQSTTQTGSTYSDILVFNSTGAATFSSTITSGSISANAGNRTLTFDNITNYGQSLIINSAGNLPLILQTNGTNALTINSIQAASFTNKVTITSSTDNSPLVFTSTTASSKNGYLYADASIIGITDTLNAGANLGGVFFNSTTKETLLFNNGNVTMKMTSTGIVGIGNSAGVGKLQVWSTTSTSGSYPFTIYNPSGVDLLYIRGDGYAYIAASAWAYGSDKRIKENIDYIETGLDKILALKPAKFDYIDGLKDNIGWIAQDVQEVIPEAVNTISETNDQLTLKSDFIVPYLVKAVQELEARIKELEAK